MKKGKGITLILDLFQDLLNPSHKRLFFFKEVSKELLKGIYKLNNVPKTREVLESAILCSNTHKRYLSVSRIFRNFQVCSILYSGKRKY